MEVQFRLITGLTVGEAGGLFGVAKEKLDLEPRFVIAVDGQGVEVRIGTEQDRLARFFTARIDDDHDIEGALEVLMIQALLVQHNVLVVGFDTRKPG